VTRIGQYIICVKALTVVALCLAISFAAHSQEEEGASQEDRSLNSAGTAGMPIARIREFHVNIGGGFRSVGGRLIFIGTSGKAALRAEHFSLESTMGQPSSETVAIISPSEKYPGRVIVSLDKDELAPELSDLQLVLEIDSSNGAYLNGAGSRYIVPPGLSSFRFADFEISTENASAWSIIEMTEDAVPKIVEGDIELVLVD
jgi:hypothetical protein